VRTVSTHQFRGVNTESIVAALSDEAVEVDDDSPTLAEVVVDIQKAQAFIPFSIEVGQDYANLEGELGNALADGKNRLEADRFTFGTAASFQPEGILTGGTVTVSGGTAAALATTYALNDQLPPRFQPNAAFVSNNAVRSANRRRRQHDRAPDRERREPRPHPRASVVRAQPDAEQHIGE
jgi:HK97 family phage major capsid protein